MLTEEMIEQARACIKRDPERAAHTLADAQLRLRQAEATLHAVRAFSQNADLALNGDKKAIEFAIGGRAL